MASLYASVAPRFTRELLSPGLRVGYTDEGGVWQFLAPSLALRLPLRAIEWRNLVGVTKRIEQLPLHFEELPLQGLRAQLPLSAVYLVKCEDLEGYRAARAPLAAWVDVMAANKVEWLVLYVPLGTRPKAAGNAPNPVYKKIFDRLRADFAHKRAAVGPASAGLLQERVCKIDTLEGTSVLGQQQQHESQWTELLLRLRRCVMDAFQTKCFQYEESLRVLDAKRGATGWDFGAFFLAKERLALMYQQMYLQDDAIRHLDELDAIFVNLNEAEKRALRDGGKKAFTSEDAIFTQSPLALDLNETQQHIASNGASARLISLYCFCRQIRTLYVMGSFPQLLRRASSFIESFLTELKDMASEGTIDWHQPYVWAVGACLEVAYACELSWSGRDEEWTASSVSVQVAQAIPVEDMSRALGDVLYLARRILKNFAKANKSRNELRVSFSNVLDVNAHEVEASLSWYQQLEQVFTAPEWRRSGVCEAYEGCLSELSHLASMHFSQSGRHRFAVFLGGECARYHLARGEYESASRLLRSLARQTEEDGWWSIFGACVRSICRAELALGRSTQAVAACFSMLQLAQEENVGVSKEEMEELMHTLVASLGKNAAKSEDHCAEEDDQMTDSVAKMNMGELFKPTVAVETTQTSESALQHGDIRVTLGITNEFPAGVHLEKVRVRFERVIVPEEMPNHEMPQEERSLNPPREHNSSAHLDELISAEAAAPDVSSNDDNESAMVDVPLMNLPTSNDNEVANIVESSDNVDKAVPHSGDHERVTEVLLEESNVHLDEKTGINLVFLHSGVPVGQYICTGIECILAGSTFQLLPPSALATASFEIAARESTVQVLIDGAPLLIPTPSSDMETVSVSIQANDDTVSNGTLELRVFKRLSRRKHDACLPQDDEEEGEGESESGGEEESGIQIIGASLRGQEKMISIPDNQTEPPEGFCKTFTVALPTLHRGSVLTYDLSLVVQPIDQLNHSNSDREDTFADDNSVTIMANVRYQRDGVTGNSSVPLATTEIRCAEAQFRVLQPLTESIRLKRVGSRIFVAVALACNDSIPVILQDYQLVCSEQGNGGAEEDPPLMVEQDPNTKLRGTRLRPRDCVHLAFTLASSPRFDTESGISFCTLQLHLQYGSDGTWQKTMSVRVPLAEVEGKRYRIDVLPRGQHSEHRFSGEMVEATSSEPVTFQVHVQEEEPQPNKAVLENDKNMMVLCLNESSERDWILVGKHLERFSLSHPVGGSRRRGFTTQKRLLATRTGQLRFPSFQLEVNGQIVPAARVHYQQGSRRMIVS